MFDFSLSSLYSKVYMMWCITDGNIVYKKEIIKCGICCLILKTIQYCDLLTKVTNVVLGLLFQISSSISCQYSPHTVARSTLNQLLIIVESAGMAWAHGNHLSVRTTALQHILGLRMSHSKIRLLVEFYRKSYQQMVEAIVHGSPLRREASFYPWWL